jgi:hypothetical protein
MGAPYLITGPHRRPAGKMVMNPRDSRDGFKGRASYLAEALGGRWSHQAGGYVMSPAAAAKLEALYRAGFTAHFRWRGEPARFCHDGRGLRWLTAAEAVRQAREAPEGAGGQP